MRGTGLAGAAVAFAVGALLSQARELTLDERIAAQEAIERVYYSHQLGTARPFETAVTNEVLEAKVRKYLSQSAALERFWNTPITDTMLERELARMASGSQLPERLLELYAALGHDTFVIKECLARAALADRLSRDFFAFDPTIHAEARERADELQRQIASGELDLALDLAGRSVLEFASLEPESKRGPVAALTHARSGESGIHRIELPPDQLERLRLRMGESVRVDEEREAMEVSVVLAATPRVLRLARYVVPKRDWETWWKGAQALLGNGKVAAVAAESGRLPMPRGIGATSGPPCVPDDTWDNGSFDDVPSPRTYHTAVWTGSQMMVWGGFDWQQALGTGGLYDPVTDSWTQVSTTGAPSPRFGHTAVWSGGVVVIWGGGIFDNLAAVGGRYDPVSDSWMPMATAGAPVTFQDHGPRCFHNHGPRGPEADPDFLTSGERVQPPALWELWKSRRDFQGPVGGRRRCVNRPRGAAAVHGTGSFHRAVSVPLTFVVPPIVVSVSAWSRWWSSRSGLGRIERLVPDVCGSSRPR